MNVSLRRLGGSLLLASLLELMLFFPVVLASYVLQPPGSTGLTVVALLLLAVYAIGYGINALLKFRHPFPKIVLALVVAAAALIPLFGITRGSIVLMLLAVVAVYRGSRFPGMPLAVRLTTQDYIVGVFLYFAGSLMQSIKHTFDDYRALYLAAGLLTLFAALYLTNRGMVSRETLSGAEKPIVEPSVRRNNRIFVGVAIGVTVLIAASYQLQALFGSAWQEVKGWLSNLFAGGGGQQEPPPQQQDIQPPPDMLPPMDKNKTMPAWVDHLLYGIVIAIGLVLLVLLLRRINRLPGWLDGLRRKFMKLFDRDKGVAARGYTDQVERIKKSERGLRMRFGRTKEERVKWKDLADNESRIRYLYRRWVGNAVKQGFAHQPHQTPQEIRRALSKESPEASAASASESLIRHYQQVRYGEGKLTDEQLQAIAAQMGQPKP